MRNILVLVLALVVLLALIYIIYGAVVKKAEAPGSGLAAPTSTFGGPPPGSVPHVNGPTEPPPSSY